MSDPSTPSPFRSAPPAAAASASCRPLDLQSAQGHHQAGRLGEAEAAYRQWLSLRPADPAALHGLGMICHQTGRPVEAVELLRRAVALAPAHAGCRSNLAAVLGQQGRHAEAAELLREAARLEPGDALLRNNLGVALENTGKLAEAAEAYRRAIALRPGYAEAHNHLGNALRALGRLAEAEAAHREAIRLKPDYGQAYNNLAATLTALGRAEEVVACFRKLVELRPGSSVAGSDLLLALHYVDGVLPGEMFAEHVRWAERHAKPLYPMARPPEAPNRERDPDRRLRVGYVSPDFREHPDGRFFEPLLAGHDQGKLCQVFCYSDVGRPDAVTARLRAYRQRGGTSPG